MQLKTNTVHKQKYTKTIFSFSYTFHNTGPSSGKSLNGRRDYQHLLSTTLSYLANLLRTAWYKYSVVTYTSAMGNHVYNCVCINCKHMYDCSSIITKTQKISYKAISKKDTKYLPLQQGCTNPGPQVAQMATFCMLAPNVCGSSFQECASMSPSWHLEF